MSRGMESGEQLERQAEKLLSGGKGFFSSLLGGGSKYEQAAEKLTEAAGAYEADKRFKEAGRAYEKGADLFDKAEDRDLEADDARKKAVNVYSSANLADDAYRVGSALVDRWKRNPDKGYQSGQILQKLSALFEKTGDTRRAVDLRMEAGDLEFPRGPAGAMKKWEEAGGLAAFGGDYARAYDIFTRLGDVVIDENLVDKGQIWPHHYFRAALCKFAASDLEGVKHATAHFDNKFEELGRRNGQWARDKKFDASNKHFVDQAEALLQLLRNLGLAVESGDTDGFVGLVQGFKGVIFRYPADVILQRIITQIEEPQEDFS